MVDLQNNKKMTIHIEIPDFRKVFDNYKKIESKQNSFSDALNVIVKNKHCDAVSFKKHFSLIFKDNIFTLGGQNTEHLELANSQCNFTKNGKQFIDVNFGNVGDIVTNIKCSHICKLLLSNGEINMTNNDIILPVCCNSWTGVQLRIIFDDKPECVTITCDVYLLNSSKLNMLSKTNVVSSGVLYHDGSASVFTPFRISNEKICNKQIHV